MHHATAPLVCACLLVIYPRNLIHSLVCVCHAPPPLRHLLQFMLDPMDGSYYFMEMNTRLQVIVSFLFVCALSDLTAACVHSVLC